MAHPVRSKSSTIQTCQRAEILHLPFQNSFWSV
jgi:hypothetical protein